MDSDLGDGQPACPKTERAGERPNPTKTTASLFVVHVPGRRRWRKGGEEKKRKHTKKERKKIKRWEARSLAAARQEIDVNPGRFPAEKTELQSTPDPRSVQWSKQSRKGRKKIGLDWEHLWSVIGAGGRCLHKLSGSGPARDNQVKFTKDGCRVFSGRGVRMRPLGRRS